MTARGTGGGQSRHPMDGLIRALLLRNDRAKDDEVAQIIERMATARFDGRVIAVPNRLRGMPFRGRALGDHEVSVIVHLAQRIIGDGQWSSDTSTAGYLADLHTAVRDPASRLVIYRRRGGPIAAILASTDRAVPAHRRGSRWLPFLYVVYSADRGTIASGYQASAIEALSIPEDARWLT